MRASFRLNVTLYAFLSLFLAIASLPLSAQSPQSEEETTPLRRTLERLDLPTRVEDSFLKIPRRFFLPEELSQFAEENQNIPLEGGGIVLDFSSVAGLLEILSIQADTRLLVYGRGCGFFSSVAATIAEEVRVIEHIDRESEKYPEIWNDLGQNNISLMEDLEAMEDNSTFFDAILLHGSSMRVSSRFISLVGEGGQLVVPVTDPQGNQVLTIIQREEGKLSISTGEELYFPPQTLLFSQ